NTAELFRSKVISIAENLSIDPNYIMACIALETGRSFNPAIKNPKSSATGLIQFMDSTAKALGTTTDLLSRMSHVEQLDYVEKY
ncbi:transglycosylase SLT domain-containing protein, partial [Aequorivita viscosa]|nr:transglycosylase SLT domain-containing protein [Aequorivita viscosa]